MMLEQWREGLRVSEAFDLEALDLTLDTPLSHHQSEIRQRRSLPTWPAQPELHSALTSALSYGSIRQDKIIEAHPATA